MSNGLLDDLLALAPPPRIQGLFAPEAHDHPLWGLSPGTGALADLLRVPVRYVLELRHEGQILAAVALPLPPRAIDTHRPAARQLEFTLGPDPIREHSPHRFMEIVLSGSSGLAHRNGHNRNGELIYRSGADILAEFDAFLDRYQHLAARTAYTSGSTPDQRPDPGPELVLRAFDEGLHVRVEPRAWRQRRDAASDRMTTSWTLEVEAFGPAQPEPEPNLLGDLARGAAALGEVVDRANTLIAVGAQAVENIRGDLGALRAPLHALARTMGLVGRVIDAGSSLIDFPAALFSDITNSATETARALQGAGLLTPGGQIRAEDAEQARAIEALRDSVEDTLSATFEAAGLLGAPPSIFEGHAGTLTALQAQPIPPRGVARPLPAHTSVERAAALFGQPSLDAVADASSLLDAHTDRQGRPLQAGDPIRLPRAQGPRDNPSPDPFGVDLRLTPAGDLKLTPDGADLSTIAGGALLEQALSVRLRTRQGSSALFPRFGLPVSPGDPFGPSMIGTIAAHVHEQTLRDRRVRAIERLEVIDGGDRAVVRASIRPLQGPALDAALALEPA